MNALDADGNFNADDAEKSITQALESSTTSLRSTQNQIRQHAPHWLSVWQLKLDLLRHKIRIDESPVGVAGVPHIVCKSLEDWENLPRLKEKALALGAEASGGVLIDLPPSPDGDTRGDHIIKSLPSQKYFRSTLTPKEDGVFDVRLTATKGKYHRNRHALQCWPRLDVSESDTTQIWDMFEAQLGQTPDDHFVAPPYAINVDAQTPGERASLGLNEQWPLPCLQGNVLDHTHSKYPGVHYPEAFVSSPGLGAPFGVHKEDFELDAINALIVGAGKLWCLVPKSQCVKLETFIQRVNASDVKCSQFVRHNYRWLSRKTLEKEGIEYTLVWQQQGQVVLALDNVYHWGFNLGENLAEAKNVAVSPWRGNPEYITCHSTCGSNEKTFINHEGMEIKDFSQDNRVDEQVLASNKEPVPASGTEQVPGPGNDLMPASDNPQVSGPGSEQVSGPGNEQAPASTRKQAPASSGEQISGPNNEQMPTSGTEQTPETSDDNLSELDNEQSSATSIEQAPVTRSAAAQLRPDANIARTPRTSILRLRTQKKRKGDTSVMSKPKRTRVGESRKLNADEPLPLQSSVPGWFRAFNDDQPEKDKIKKKLTKAFSLKNIRKMNDGWNELLLRVRQTSDRVLKARKISAKDEDRILRIFHSAANVETISAFVEVIKASGRSSGQVDRDSTNTDGHRKIESNRQRYDAIQRLQNKSAHFQLLIRCHLMQFAKDTSFVITTPNAVRKEKQGLQKPKKRHGNPVSGAKAVDTDTIMHEVFPNCKSTDQQYTRLRREITLHRRLGRRWRCLALGFGYGVLALISMNPIGTFGALDNTYVRWATFRHKSNRCCRLSHFSDDAFEVLFAFLEDEKPYLKDWGSLTEKHVTAIFNDDHDKLKDLASKMDGSATFVEQLDDSENFKKLFLKIFE